MDHGREERADQPTDQPGTDRCSHGDPRPGGGAEGQEQGGADQDGPEPLNEVEHPATSAEVSHRRGARRHLALVDDASDQAADEGGHGQADGHPRQVDVREPPDHQQAEVDLDDLPTTGDGDEADGPVQDEGDDDGADDGEDAVGRAAEQVAAQPHHRSAHHRSTSANRRLARLTPSERISEITRKMPRSKR